MPAGPAPDEGLEHDEGGDVWARRTGTPRRDREADRAVREAMLRELGGEYDESGTFRPSIWRPA